MKKENYYVELIKEIDNFIKVKKYKEAKNIIEEELNVPYVPIKLEQKLLFLRKEISPYVNEEENFLNAEKIFDILIKHKDIDKNELIDSLAEFNLKKYKKEIREILKLKESEIPYTTKVKLMHLLLMQGIEGTWEVFTLDNKLKTFDLTGRYPITKDSDFNEISYKIDKILFKNPIVLSLALNILENIFFKMIFEDVRPELHNAAETVSLIAAELAQDHKLLDELIKIYEKK